jgi:hypothetical protein
VIHAVITPVTNRRSNNSVSDVFGSDLFFLAGSVFGSSAIRRSIPITCFYGFACQQQLIIVVLYRIPARTIFQLAFSLGAGKVVATLSRRQ